MDTMIRTAMAAAALTMVPTLALLPAGAQAQEVAAAPPSLAFKPANIARVKQLIASDPEARTRWNALRKTADRALSSPPRGDREIDSALEALALAFRVTGQAKYAQGARTILLQRAARTDWLTDAPLARRDPPWKSDLGMGYAAASTGIAYDAVRDTLSQADRQTIVQGLIRGAILPIMDDWIDGAKRIHALDTMGHNWWAHIVFGAGVAALAVRPDDPRGLEWARRIDEASVEWFEFPGTRIGTKPPTFGRDGAYSETVSYAELALHSLMLFRRSWTEAMGTAPSPIKGLDKIAGYFLATSYPRSEGWVSLNFGDSRPPSCGCHTLADLWALGDHNPEYLKYIAGFSGVPAKDAWKDATNLPYFPDAPARASASSSIGASRTYVSRDQGLLTMRSDWSPDATLLGVKSGFTWNHNHADAGSFILYHKGHTLIADSGHSGYSTPEYDGYYRQSEAHNVVTIDGHAEPASDLYDGSASMGTIDHVLDTPNIRYAWADATGPTSRYFQRNYRNILWVGDTILLVDDLRSRDAGQFEWLLHHGGTATRKGRTVEIRDGDAGVDVTPLFPAALPDGGLPTDYPYALRLVSHEGLADEDPKIKQAYLGFQPVGKSDREKFLVALQPRSEGKPASRIERIEGTNWIGVRITGIDRITEVYFNLLADGRLRHRNANATMAGIDTDAYILAVSHPMRS
ncbi:hypothetical protein A8V01_26720, partial [Novosphingobium guangzhouense]